MPISIAPDISSRIALFLENKDLIALANGLRQFRHGAVEELIRRELVRYRNYALSEMEKRFLICAKLGMTDWVSKYIDAGVNIHVSIKIDDHNVQAIHFAALSGVLNCVKVLVKAEATLVPVVPTRFYLSPLHFAAEGGNPACVEYLVDVGIPVDQEAPAVFWLGSQYTALQIAARHRKPACVTMLISKNANVHHATTNDTQAIHVAADVPNNAPVIKILIDNKANPNVKTGSGWTPLMLAMRHTECEANLKELLTGGANPREPNVFDLGLLPLQILISHKLHAAATTLLEFDPTLINAVATTRSRCPLDYGDYTALHVVVMRGYINEVIFLLNHHANIEITTRKGKKAIDVVRKRDEHIKNILQEHTMSLKEDEEVESKIPSMRRT
jgi:ankyrin repeat protein